MFLPNIKSAKKRVKVNKTKALNNQMFKSALKTAIKKFDTTVTSGADSAKEFRYAISKIDRAVTKGILHKNTAARKKSQLAIKFKNAAV